MFFNFSIVTVLARHPALSGTGPQSFWKGWWEWCWQHVCALHRRDRTCAVSQPRAQEPHSAGARHGGISLLSMPPYTVGTTVYISQRCTDTSLWHVPFFLRTSVKTHLYGVYSLLQSGIGKRDRSFCRQLYNQLNSVLCRICGLPKSNCWLGKNTGFIHSEETKGTLCLFCTLKP